MEPEKIGKIIKQIRKDNNLTQQELADKLGVTYQAVSKWETGKNIPDIAIIKQISEEFNIDINEFLSGNIQKKKQIQVNPLVIVFIILIILYILIIVFHQEDYEFKTLTTTCKEFEITGSMAYNNKDSSIYISNVNYCGGNDNQTYKKITCTLYEDFGNTKTKISNCTNKNNKNITLENYLKDVELNIDKYKANCKNIKNAKLYLEINATDKKDKTIAYKIPLKQNENCPK